VAFLIFQRRAKKEVECFKHRFRGGPKKERLQRVSHVGRKISKEEGRERGKLQFHSRFPRKGCKRSRKRRDQSKVEWGEALGEKEGGEELC